MLGPKGVRVNAVIKKPTILSRKKIYSNKGGGKDKGRPKTRGKTLMLKTLGTGKHGDEAPKWGENTRSASKNSLFVRVQRVRGGIEIIHSARVLSALDGITVQGLKPLPRVYTVRSATRPTNNEKKFVS